MWRGMLVRARIQAAASPYQRWPFGPAVAQLPLSEDWLQRGMEIDKRLVP